MTASLITLKDEGDNFGLGGFQDCGATVEFFSIMRKWFNIHNVKNTTYYLRSRDDNLKHFFEVEDSRLHWLEKEFLNYLDMWKMSCQFPRKQFISTATYEAIVLTTMSTVHCIRYLLKSGFHFVLTRKFSSDQIEILFSAVRRLGGSNDQTNAVVVVQAIHKILATGIISASLSANSVGPGKGISTIMTKCSAPQQKSNSISLTNKDDTDLHTLLEPQLKSLENGMSQLDNSLKSATLSVIASYLIRTIKDNIECENCKTMFVSDRHELHILSLLKNIDRGGFFYPTEDFLKIVTAIDSATEIAVPYVYTHEKPLLKLTELLLPSLCRNLKMICSNASTDENHVKKLSSLLLRKFLRPYISNYCRKSKEVQKIKKKLCAQNHLRKVHKI